MWKYYIVDDEQDAIDALDAMLQKKFTERVTFSGSNNKASRAIEEIIALQPDIVFLDVEMPEMTGLELLKQIPSKNFQVIFTTAHERYALPAIKAAAADYLLKPLSIQDMEAALDRCDKALAKTNPSIPAALTINTGNQLIVLQTADIIRIEGNNNYSDFYCINRPKFTVSKTLKEFEKQLMFNGFFRIHQSHLINLAHVSSVLHGADKVLLNNNHSVEISRRKKQEFLQQLRSRQPNSK
ncbi:MAG: response regulator transcription factor [Sphingobacteriales bacterium]|nr:MAG: response regulator transcription factor [Sphingobacteriales bacterium]